MENKNFSKLRMTKNLILIRHAKSSWSPYNRKNFSGDDHQRPLNIRGNQAANVIGSYLRSKYGTIDKVFSSSALRASQTYTIIKSHVHSTYTGNIDATLYTFEAKKLLAYIRNIDDQLKNIIIVAHNPAIHEICLSIIIPNDHDEVYARMKKKFPTCGTAQIRLNCTKWIEVKNNCGHLENFVTPKLISD